MFLRLLNHICMAITCICVRCLYVCKYECVLAHMCTCVCVGVCVCVCASMMCVCVCVHTFVCTCALESLICIHLLLSRMEGNRQHFRLK